MVILLKNSITDYITSSKLEIQSKNAIKPYRIIENIYKIIKNTIKVLKISKQINKIQIKYGKFTKINILIEQNIF